MGVHWLFITGGSDRGGLCVLQFDHSLGEDEEGLKKVFLVVSAVRSTFGVKEVEDFGKHWVNFKKRVGGIKECEEVKEFMKDNYLFSALLFYLFHLVAFSGVPPSFLNFQMLVRRLLHLQC